MHRLRQLVSEQELIKHQLLTNISQLEADRVILLRNTNTYETEAHELRKEIAGVNKRIKDLQEQQTELQKELDKMCQEDEETRKLLQVTYKARMINTSSEPEYNIPLRKWPDSMKTEKPNQKAEATLSEAKSEKDKTQNYLRRKERHQQKEKEEDKE